MNRELAQSGNSLIERREREDKLGQKGQTLWITGPSGSGKRELAYVLERRLFDEGKTVIVLDASNIRAGLSQELDFTPTDRAEHLRRVAHICNVLNNQGIITICAFRSPDEEIREQVKEIIGSDRYTLIYMGETSVVEPEEKYDIPTDADYTINIAQIENIEELIRRI